MAKDDTECYCIDEARCRLCQFQLKDGESVLVVLGGDRASNSFPFHQDGTVEDQETGIVLHMCCRSGCIRRYRQMHCFHDGCYSFKVLPISSTFLTATKYHFSPPISSEGQRQRRIRYAFARGLKFGLLRKIPLELCEMIAGYLVRECAIVTYQELAHDSIEGIVYVQSLHNAPQPEGTAKQIFAARHDRVIQKIYVAYDHLGIRSIRFALPSHDSLGSFCDSCGRWWTELARNTGIQRVVARSDVRTLFLYAWHGTDPLSARNDVVPRQGWPTPGLDCRLIDLDACDIAEATPDCLRMMSFDCNKPTTDGYSAAICGLHVAKLYTHHSGTTSTNFYRDMDGVSSSMLWMYMPVDQDEYLKEIWAIKASGSGFTALLLFISYERAVIFGSYILHPNVRLQLHRVYVTTNCPSQIYFNDWDPLCDNKWIKYLGVDASAAKTDMALVDDQQCRTQYPLSLTPSSPPPYTQYNELWYYTNCRLEDVTEITCCSDKAAPHRPIIGMLLRYSNGITLDTLTMNPLRPLSIGFGKTKRRFSYVAEVNLKELGEPGLGSISRMDIPWHGRLEWWFSQRQCKLYYSD
ncbi:hypothetical protein F5Y09DRAFT_328644 [Xylaria sp. FL1042]|nr:hypothetical protein F5Y09DRAFT_328644 [Xylaria sp. FL1042]